MFKTKRLGDATLILAMIAGMLAGIIASSLSSLLGTTYASLESSGIGIKAQQLTKSRANEINALAYQDIQTYAPEPLRLIADTGLYRQTKVDPEITNADGSKSTVVTVDVFRSNYDINPIFSLSITQSNKKELQENIQIASSNGNSSLSVIANSNYKKATFIITTKFNSNPDSASNRYAKYAIFIVDGIKDYPQTNIWNGKYGGGGHYWTFEGYASINLTYNYDIKKGSTVSATLNAQSYHQRSDITVILSK